MIWFTADLHLGHANIIAHAHRPFSDVREMNERLIGAINDRVSWTDELWVLGDFAYRVKKPEVRAFRERICCRTVHLVRGNHDVRFGDGSSPFSSEVAYSDQMRTPAPERRRLVLFHYPILDWNGAFHGSWHLHGHIHETRAYNERNREAGICRYDVGVDANDYAPVSMAEISDFFRDVEPRSTHHEGVPAR